MKIWPVVWGAGVWAFGLLHIRQRNQIYDGAAGHPETTLGETVAIKAFGGEVRYVSQLDAIIYNSPLYVMPAVVLGVGTFLIVRAYRRNKSASKK